MAPTSLSLFDDDDFPPQPTHGTLAIRPAAKRPLNAAERAFNRALRAVQTWRGRLDAEKRRLDDALVFHAAHVRPRIDRAVALRVQLVRALAPFLDNPRLKSGDRLVLAAIVREQLDDVLAHVRAPDPDLQALFERLHGIGYAQAAQDGLEEARSEMAAMFGELGIDVDVPELRADMSQEEIAAATAQLMDDMRRTVEGSAKQPKPGRTKRQLREEARAQRVEQMRKDHIGAVYRRLVKVLHPDLESDDTERRKKNHVMQEVTSAHARGDLHALLRLELEWLGGAGADAARLSDEKLRAYTALLKEQATELQAECEALRYHPRYMELVVDGPFGLPTLIDGPRESARLDFVIEQVRAGAERLTSSLALQEVRGAIQEYRQARGTKRRRRREGEPPSEPTDEP